jgi:hypothetical protein
MQSFGNNWEPAILVMVCLMEQRSMAWHEVDASAVGWCISAAAEHLQDGADICVQCTRIYCSLP